MELSNWSGSFTLILGDSCLSGSMNSVSWVRALVSTLPVSSGSGLGLGPGSGTGVCELSLCSSCCLHHQEIQDWDLWDSLEVLRQGLDMACLTVFQVDCRI